LAQPALAPDPFPPIEWPPRRLRAPQARLALKLAQDEIAQARQLIAQQKNGDAARVLEQAKADAELAVGLAREAKAEREAHQAVEQIRLLQSAK